MPAETKRETIESMRRAMHRAGRLHWFHWAAIGFSLIVTLGAWLFSKSQIEAKVYERFEGEAHQVVELVVEHMRLYEGALLGGVAAHDAANGELSYSEWREFSSSLRIDERYPGINGLGVIHSVARDQLDAYLEKQRRERPEFQVFPKHDQPELLPITYSEPASANSKAIGLDVAHEHNRYQAAKLARHTGRTTITGPIVLVQDAENTPGFLFYAPFYGRSNSGEEAAGDFRGLVYAPFIMSKLMKGTLQKSNRHVGISITDGGETLYDEHHAGEPDYDADPLFRSVVEANLFGRQWTFDIHSTLDFRRAVESEQPQLILFGGLAIDSLLLVLFVMISRSNRRAVDYVDQMTGDLRQRTAELEASNEDLERFAHVASHDLRTPLRGVSDLVEYLGEDLEEYLEQAEANPDVPKNLNRILQQVARMDDLIRGVLDYASVDKVEPEITRVDLRSAIAHIAFESKLREDQLILDLEIESLETEAILLHQVLANLIGNAAKYHGELEHAIVTVRTRVHGGSLQFTVEDDGPGIDPDYHARIFEPFKTLQPRDEVESTGIGLAIVKKAVERLGGTVWIESSVGTGTRFTFNWPLQAVATQSERA